MSGFVKATRKQKKLKLALEAVSGGGKTWSALEIMRGIIGPQGKMAVMDSENDSASLYSDRHDFDTMNLRAPYTAKLYIDGIKAAIDAGYNGLIIDSISHEWG